MSGGEGAKGLAVRGSDADRCRDAVLRWLSE